MLCFSATRCKRVAGTIRRLPKSLIRCMRTCRCECARVMTLSRPARHLHHTLRATTAGMAMLECLQMTNQRGAERCSGKFIITLRDSGKMCISPGAPLPTPTLHRVINLTTLLPEFSSGIECSGVKDVVKSWKMGCFLRLFSETIYENTSDQYKKTKVC